WTRTCPATRWMPTATRSGTGRSASRWPAPSWVRRSWPTVTTPRPCWSSWPTASRSPSPVCRPPRRAPQRRPTADGTDPVTTNTLTYTNVFDTGSIELSKAVVGDAAHLGVGPFEFAGVCTLDDDTVWDGSVELNQDNALQVSIDNLAAGAQC